MGERYLLGCLALLFSIAPAYPNETSFSTPHFQNFVDRLVRPQIGVHTPGCVIGVVYQGKLVFEKAYGMADIQRGRPLQTDSRFEISSNSKQFIALAIALLEREGKLHFKDPLQKFLPQFRGQPIGKVTVWQLGHHQSGIQEYTGLIEQDPDTGFFTDATVMSALEKNSKLDFKPGTRSEYSNSNYFFLGQIIQRVSRKSLSEFTKDHIFSPLGMDRSLVVSDNRDRTKDSVRGYRRSDKTFKLFEPHSPGLGDDGIRTTLHDFFLWDQNFYQNHLGGGAELIKTLRVPGTLSNGEITDDGFGLGIDEYRGYPLDFYEGESAGFISSIDRLMSLNTSVIILCNRNDLNPDPREFSRRILDYVIDVIKTHR